MNQRYASTAIRRVAALAGLFCLTACSGADESADPIPGNAALDSEATANALENMANELESGAE